MKAPRWMPPSKSPLGRASPYAFVLAAVALVASGWYLGTHYNWRAVWGVLREVDVAWLLLGGLGAVAIQAFFRSLRSMVLLRALDHQLPFSEIYRTTVFAAGVNCLTPFQAGELLRAEMWHARGITRHSGYGVVLIERVLDLATIILLAQMALIFDSSLRPALPIHYVLPGLLVLAGVAAAGFLVLRGLAARRPAVDRWYRPLRRCATCPRALAIAILFGLAAWTAVGAGWWFAFHSTGARLGLSQCIAALSVSTLASLLTFVPAGLGVAESSVAFILSCTGVPSATALAGALLLRLYGALPAVFALLHLVSPVYRHTKLPTFDNTPDGEEDDEENDPPFD